jgi:hypothetical protein
MADSAASTDWRAGAPERWPGEHLAEAFRDALGSACGADRGATRSHCPS